MRTKKKKMMWNAMLGARLFGAMLTAQYCCGTISLSHAHVAHYNVFYVSLSLAIQKLNRIFFFCSKIIHSEEKRTRRWWKKHSLYVERDIVHLHSASKFLLLFGCRVTYRLQPLTHVRWFHHEWSPFYLARRFFILCVALNVWTKALVRGSGERIRQR